jgi:hypothetical protein
MGMRHNIFSVNNAVQNDIHNLINLAERMELELLPKLSMDYRPRGPLDARSYAGRINPSYRESERVESFKP